MYRKRCQKRGLLNQALSSVKTHGVGSGVQLEGNLNVQLKNKKVWLGRRGNVLQSFYER